MTKKAPAASEPSGRPSLSRTGRVALNGRFLDEVRTRLHVPTAHGSVSYLCLPEEHHRAIPDRKGFILRTSAITALQLYYEGVLATGQMQSIELAIDNRLYGAYFVEWLRHDPHQHGGTDMVLLRLVPAPGSRTHTPAGRPRIDNLVPLRVKSRGVWDPQEEYWGEDDEPPPDWAKPIIARGPRLTYEMQQVLPGSNPDDPDSDPIIQANDLRDSGRTAQARRLLLRLIEQDPRCLDAHAHLGNLEFDKHPEKALAHYETGVSIGQHALGKAFDGLLSWGLIDNRPFLRCMQGYGLCLWRLGRFDEAGSIFEQLLWLNPTDNQGIRFLLPWIRTRTEWRDDIG